MKHAIALLLEKADTYSKAAIMAEEPQILRQQAEECTRAAKVLEFAAAGQPPEGCGMEALARPGDPSLREGPRSHQPVGIRWATVIGAVPTRFIDEHVVVTTLDSGRYEPALLTLVEVFPDGSIQPVKRSEIPAYEI